MGTDIFCDYCGTSVPIADSAYPVIVGKNEIARVCIHCSQKIESIVKTQKNTVLQDRRDIISLGKEYREIKTQEEVALEIRKPDNVEKPVEDDKKPEVEDHGNTQQAHSGDKEHSEEDLAAQNETAGTEKKMA